MPSIDIFFDGTGNNKNNDKPKGAHTNVARLFDISLSRKFDMSYNDNPAPIDYDKNPGKEPQNEAIYFDGVGSSEPKPWQLSKQIKKSVEGGTGLGGNRREQNAYDIVTAFFNKHPDRSHEINIVGFSRGAAQARSFANTLIKKGIPKLDEFGNTTREYLVKPGKTAIKNLAMFDTVASYGIATNDSHVGRDLQIHKNVENPIHLVALNEYRKTFPLTSAISITNKNVHEIAFPGAHSQVGGGYKGDILSAGPLAYMHSFLSKNGMTFTELSNDDQNRVDAYNKMMNNPDAVASSIIDSRIATSGKPFFLEPSQTHDFEIATQGRKTIFETSDHLGRLSAVLKFVTAGRLKHEAAEIQKLRKELSDSTPSPGFIKPYLRQVPQSKTEAKAADQVSEPSSEQAAEKSTGAGDTHISSAMKMVLEKLAKNHALKGLGQKDFLKGFTELHIQLNATHHGGVEVIQGFAQRVAGEAGYDYKTSRQLFSNKEWTDASQAANNGDDKRLLGLLSRVIKPTSGLDAANMRYSDAISLRGLETAVQQFPELKPVNQCRALVSQYCKRNQIPPEKRAELLGTKTAEMVKKIAEKTHRQQSSTHELVVKFKSKGSGFER